MANTRISIITVSYNTVKTIEQTINSVVNQTYSNIEYIIIDGGSTDGTVDIIKKYEDKIIYWVSEPDKGIYDAMNKGIDVSSGDYIYFLGADDCLVDVDVIRAISSFLNEESDLLSAPVWIVDEKSRLEILSQRSINKGDLLRGKMIPHQGVFVKGKIMRQYKFDCRYKIAADYDFIMKCLKNDKKILYIEKPVAYFSMSGMSSNNEKLREYEYRKIITLHNISKSEVSKMKYQYLKNILYMIIKNICVRLDIWRKIQQQRGWIVHKCKNEKCRWCDR